MGAYHKLLSGYNLYINVLFTVGASRTAISNFKPVLPLLKQQVLTGSIVSLNYDILLWASRLRMFRIYEWVAKISSLVDFNVTETLYLILATIYSSIVPVPSKLNVDGQYSGSLNVNGYTYCPGSIPSSQFNMLLLSWKTRFLLSSKSELPGIAKTFRYSFAEHLN